MVLPCYHLDMKKILSLLFVLLLSFSLFASDPAVLVSLLVPGLLYSGETFPASYDISSLDAGDLNSLLVPKLMEDGDVRLASMVKGPAADIVQGFFGLVGALMPLDYMHPVEGSGTVTLSILPPLPESALSIGAAVDYDDVMVFYAVDGESDGSVTYDGSVEAYMDLSTPSLFTLLVSASSLSISGTPVSGSVELSVDLDDEATASYLSMMGADISLYRELFSSMILEGIREMGGDEVLELEALLGISLDDIVSGDIVAYLEENEVLDLIDLVILATVASDSGLSFEDVMLSVLSGRLVIDGAECVDIDAEAFIEAISMMDSL